MGISYASEDDQVASPSGGITYGDEEPVFAPEPKMIETPVTGPGGEATGHTEMVEAREPKPAEDLPTVAEMPLNTVPTFGKTAKTQFGLMFSSTPEGARNVIEKNVPGARYGSDKYNNPIVIVPDDKGVEQAYHLDKPGLNALDFSRFAGKSMAAIPAALAAAYVAPAATVGMPLSIAAQGVAGGVSSLGEDVISNLMGTEEVPDLGKAALSTIIGAAGPVAGEAAKSLAGLWKPDIFNSMSRGAQNFLKRVSAKLAAGDIPIPKDGRDVILDTPQFRALAKSIIDESPDSAAAKMITQHIEQRDAATATRIRDDVNHVIGRPTVSEREADAAFKAYMKTLSGEETPLLKNAPPIDPSAIVQKIDGMLPTAQGKTAKALKSIRSLFVEDEGTAGTSASVKEIKDPNTGRVIRREHIPAEPGTPPTYKTNPQSLEHARTEIDSLINHGDETLGIGPGELRGREAAIGSIRKDLSQLLKDNIPGYEKVMGKYTDVYALIKANEMGQNLFSAGQRAVRPDQVSNFMSSPAEGPALRASVRSLINEKLNGSVEDVAALRGILGGEQNNNRKSLEIIFGKPEVNRIARIVDREMGFRQTSKDLLPARAAAQGAEMSKEFANDIGDITLPQTVSHAGSMAMQPVSTLRRIAKGTQGPQFREDLSRFMTTPAENLPAYARGMQKSMSIDQAVKNAQAFAPFAENVPTASQGRATEENAGGRINRATGGAVNLMALSKAAKKQVTQSTEDLLNVDDSTVARALEVANKHI